MKRVSEAIAKNRRMYTPRPVPFRQRIKNAILDRIDTHFIRRQRYNLWTRKRGLMYLPSSHYEPRRVRDLFHGEPMSREWALSLNEWSHRGEEHPALKVIREYPLNN